MLGAHNFTLLEASSLLLLRQEHSQNLKEVPQNFTEVLNIDDVTANDVIQRNQYCKRKKINMSSIAVTDVKLAS